MREIKLRAWAKNVDVMHPVWNVVSNEGGAYILMQYTGLKDKNGKEIYESDLVDKDGTTCEVAWYEERARWGMKYEAENNEIFDPMLNDVVVIGNIYENPELLT